MEGPRAPRPSWGPGSWRPAAAAGRRTRSTRRATRPHGSGRGAPRRRLGLLQGRGKGPVTDMASLVRRTARAGDSSCKVRDNRCPRERRATSSCAQSRSTTCGSFDCSRPDMEAAEPPESRMTQTVLSDVTRGRARRPLRQASRVPTPDTGRRPPSVTADAGLSRGRLQFEPSVMGRRCNGSGPMSRTRCRVGGRGRREALVLDIRRGQAKLTRGHTRSPA